jgi:hypothetical protein
MAAGVEVQRVAGMFVAVLLSLAMTVSEILMMLSLREVRLVVVCEE